MLKIKFNQTNAANSSITALFNKYQHEIGFDNIVKLLHYKIYLLDQLGEYETAVNELKNFLDNVSHLLSKEELKLFKEKYSVYNSLRHQKKPTIFKPETDVEIPFGTLDIDLTFKNKEEILQKDTLTYGIVKVSIQEKEYIFLFDTGCEKTCIFNNISNDINLHYLVDSINVIGTGIVQGRGAMLDSISLGEITLCNSIIAVTDNVMKVPGAYSDKTVESIQGVFGMDFIKRLGEIQLYQHDRKIIIPQKESELPVFGRNIMIDDNNRPIIKAFNEDDLTSFLFDAGSNSNHMYKSYYLKNKDEIETKLDKGTGYSTAVGTPFSIYTSYKIPSFSLSIGETSFSLKNLDVFTERSFMEDPIADGTLGMDFVTIQPKQIALLAFKRVRV